MRRFFMMLVALSIFIFISCEDSSNPVSTNKKIDTVTVTKTDTVTKRDTVTIRSPATEFEYVHINVPDKMETADWYVKYLDMEKVASSDTSVIYLTDKDHNFMIEFGSDSTLKNTHNEVPFDAYHLAFNAKQGQIALGKTLIANGAKSVNRKGQPTVDLPADSLPNATSNPSINTQGDYVYRFKDKNGMNVELVRRVDPFYPVGMKSDLRFEHFAFNVKNQLVSALWYTEAMGLTQPWSKDINTSTNFISNYRVAYVGDVEKRMTLEIYADTAKLYTSIDSSYSYHNLSHGVIHIGFSTNNPDSLAKFMIKLGAKGKVPVADLVNKYDKVTLANGDEYVDLRDPRGAPIRLIKRKLKLLQ